MDVLTFYAAPGMGSDYIIMILYAVIRSGYESI